MVMLSEPCRLLLLPVLKTKLPTPLKPLKAPASMETLIDSPVITGEYFRTVDLTPGKQPPHVIDIVGDSAADLDIKPEDVRHFSHLVAEANALFGAHHYRDYHECSERDGAMEEARRRAYFERLRVGYMSHVKHFLASWHAADALRSHRPLRLDYYGDMHLSCR